MSKEELDEIKGTKTQEVEKIFQELNVPIQEEDFFHYNKVSYFERMSIPEPQTIKLSNTTNPLACY